MLTPSSHTEAAFETVLETDLLAAGYIAVDPDEIRRTTRLAGDATHFLSFSRGRTYRAAYLIPPGSCV